jgi:hypothetical protein
MVGSVCCLKLFTTGLRISLKDIWKSQMMPDQVALLRLWQLIRADNRVMIDSVVTALGCSHGLAYGILHDYLKLRKMCARWVPRE